jgi:sugar phosphate isomerase/epimerase
MGIADAPRMREHQQKAGAGKDIRMDRRDLLIGGASALAAASLARGALAQTPAPAAALQKLKIDAYSRHLLWLKTAEEVADAVVEMGFDGLDITVRTMGGHVNPATVKADLPKFVGVIRGAGILVDTITTNISDVDSPNAEAILDAASQLGIKHYWWGTYRYDIAKPIQPQIEALKPRVAKLAKLNEKYGMKAMYHNYSGGRTVGDTIFDFLSVLQNFDPRWVSFHYDVGHATEGAPNGTWALGMRAAGPYIGGMSFKDSYYKLELDTPEGGAFTGTPEQLNPPRGGGFGGPGGGPNGPGGAPGGAAGGRAAGAPAGAPPAGARGAAPPGGRRGGNQTAIPGMPSSPRGGGGATNPWRLVQVPLGMGLVDLPLVAQVMKEISFQGPVEIQAEYPNGGAGGGQDKITLPRAQVLGAMKHDLLTLRAVLGPAGLI